MDGQVIAETNTTLRPAGPLTGANPSLCIGNAPGTAGFPFDGWIDEISLYSRALSQAEIQGIYNAGSAGKCFPASAPVILVQPQSQVGYWGQPLTFSVTAGVAPPLSYLWYKDGFAIPWATNSSLVLTNLALDAGGNYSVVVSNQFGSVTSSNAFLLVNPAGVSLGLYPGLMLEGTPGKTFGIQYATNLSPTTTWMTITQVTLMQPIQLWFDTADNIAHGTNPRRFYRVVAVP
jgi:Immunoglobulin domain/Concanavalin A-like lectin/glucanases superfamily